MRWYYAGGHPDWAARFLNRIGARALTRGIAPHYPVTLEVPGRVAGRMISLPLVMAVDGGERYLVSMLGTNANWVRNVQAAHGDVTLRHGRRESVHLEATPVEAPPPVLRAYLLSARCPTAPGAQ